MLGFRVQRHREGCNSAVINPAETVGSAFMNARGLFIGCPKDRDAKCLITWLLVRPRQINWPICRLNRMTCRSNAAYPFFQFVPSANVARVLHVIKPFGLPFGSRVFKRHREGCNSAVINWPRRWDRLS